MEKQKIKTTTDAKYTVVFSKDAGKWQIKRAGSDKAVQNFATKEQALERVKWLSKTQDVAVSVKKKNGKFGKN